MKCTNVGYTPITHIWNHMNYIINTCTKMPVRWPWEVINWMAFPTTSTCISDYLLHQESGDGFFYRFVLEELSCTCLFTPFHALSLELTVSDGPKKVEHSCWCTQLRHWLPRQSSAVNITYIYTETHLRDCVLLVDLQNKAFQRHVVNKTIKKKKN